MENTELYSVVPKKTVLRKKERFNNIPEKSIGMLLLSDLTPFKQLMKQQLKERGYYTDYMPFKSIVPLYYNEFASNQVNKKNYLTPINNFEFSNNLAFKIKPSDKLNGNLFDVRNLNKFEDIENVVSGVFNVFKLSNEKLINNVPVTNEELKQGYKYKQIQTDLENKALENKSISIKNVKSFIYLVLIFGALYYIFK